MEAPPIIIVGVGRSGTSLLQSMLHAHPEVTFLPETHFFRNYVAPAHRRRFLEMRGAHAFGELLREDAAFRRAGLSVDRLLEPWLDCTERFRLAAVYRRMLSLERADRGAALVGDKDPRLLDFLEPLRAFVPEARVLHIVRDPRDVLASRLKAGWSEHRPGWLHTLIYRAQLGPGRRSGRRAFGDAYHELRYEALIASPRRVLERICARLDLPFREEMLSFGEAAGDLVDSTEVPWKKETLGPLLSNNAGKWRDALTPAQVRLVEAVCSEPFDTMGYERSGAPVRSGVGGRLLRGASSVGAALFAGLYGIRKRLG